MQFLIRRAKRGIITPAHRRAQALQNGAQALRLPGRALGMRGGLPRGEALQQRAQRGKATEFGIGHGQSMRNRTAGYARNINPPSRDTLGLRRQRDPVRVPPRPATYAESHTPDPASPRL
jgi:hypothetical protein